MAAINWWEKAGDAASHSSASGEAIAHYRSALSLQGDGSSDPLANATRAKLCQKLAAILMQTEGFQSERAKGLYDQSNKIALAAQDLDTYVRGSVALLTSQYQAGLYETALEQFEKVPGSTLSQITVATRAKFLRARGTARFCVGRLVDAQSDFVAAIRDADTLQSDPQHSLLVGDPAISGRAYASETLMMLGFASQSREMAGDALRIARSRGHAFDIEWSLQVIGRTNNWLCRFGEAADALAEALSICEQYGFESHRGAVLLHYGAAQIGLGNSAKGSADFDRGCEIWTRATGPIHLSRCLAIICGCRK